MIVSLIVAMAAQMVAQTAALADYQTGVQAYQQGNFPKALKEWQRVIESPAADVHPQELAETFYAVAMLFWMGQGVEQNTVSAAGFLRQAAELNHAGAQSKLGYLYLIGQGVPESKFEAIKWLEMAARQGDADAQYNLAVMYRDGIGVPVDSTKAMQWFEEAAANGDPVSAEVVAQYQRQGSLQQAEPLVAQADLAEADEGLSLPEHATEPEADLEEVFDSQPQTEMGPEGANGEAWILARDSEHHTIQVIALKNLQSMTRLIDDHPDMAPFAIYRQGDEKAPLYVLVQGDYPTIDAARLAQQQFPASLAEPSQLWIRRYGMVQDLINKRKTQPSQGSSSHGTN